MEPQSPPSFGPQQSKAKGKGKAPLKPKGKLSGAAKDGDSDGTNIKTPSKPKGALKGQAPKAKGLKDPVKGKDVGSAKAPMKKIGAAKGIADKAGAAKGPLKKIGAEKAPMDKGGGVKGPLKKIGAGKGLTDNTGAAKGPLKKPLGPKQKAGKELGGDLPKVLSKNTGSEMESLGETQKMPSSPGKAAIKPKGKDANLSPLGKLPTNKPIMKPVGRSKPPVTKESTSAADDPTRNESSPAQKSSSSSSSDVENESPRDGAEGDLSSNSDHSSASSSNAASSASSESGSDEDSSGDDASQSEEAIEGDDAINEDADEGQGEGEGGDDEASRPRRPTNRLPSILSPRSQVRLIPRLNMQSVRGRPFLGKLPEDAMLIRDEKVLEELRAIVFDRRVISRQPKETDTVSVRVPGRVTVERAEIVKEWLPDILKRNEADPAETIKLLYHILPSTPEDPQIPGMISTVFERTGELRKAYVWAFHSYAIDRSRLYRRRIQLVAERLLLNQVALRDNRYGVDTLPMAAKAAALRSPYDVDEFLQPPRPPKTEVGNIWVKEAQSDLYKMEGRAPFRMLSCKKIQPGTTLLIEEPLAIAPSFDETELKQIGVTCFFCLEQLNILDMGYHCPLMPYSCPFKFCSMDCFKRYAPIHKYSCAFVHCQLFPLAQESGFDPSFILLLVRLLLRAFLARSAPEDEYVFIDRRDPLVPVARLPSYEAETRRLRPELWNCITTLSALLKHTFPLVNRMGLSHRDLEDLICRLHTHSFPVLHRPACKSLQGQGRPIASGIVLCGELSNFSHSCIPNCYADYDPKKGVCLRAITSIREKANLCFSMLADLYVPSSSRKTLSSSMKIIDCICGRCRDPSEGGRFVSGLRCHKCIFGFRCPRRSPRISALMYRRHQIHYVGLPADPVSLVEWECTDCGRVNFGEARDCSIKLGRWSQRYSELIKRFQPGNEAKEDIVIVRQNLEDLFEELMGEAHPFNFILYQTAATLAGAWQVDPQRNFPKALEYFRVADVAARAVLPLAWPELMDLAGIRAAVTYRVICDLKRKKEAPQSIDRSLSEPLWRALWTAYCCFGSGSAQWLHCVTQLRLYLSLNVETSEAIMPRVVLGRISSTHLLAQIATRLWPSAGVPTKEELQAQADRDPSIWWFTACRIGDLFTIRAHLTSGASDEEKSMWMRAVDGRTGFPALGVAALNGHYALFKYLLSRSKAVDLLFRNEWGLTIPLAICAKRIESSVADITIKRQDRLHAKMICDFLDRIRATEKDDSRLVNSTFWNRLIGGSESIEAAEKKTQPLVLRVLTATSSPLVGGLQAIHYAAARGKHATVREMLKVGVDVNARNVENATPLHLATLSGNDRTVRTLLLTGADVEALNFRGETPFMLACYSLKLTTCGVLLAAGAQVDYISPQTGANCLHALVAGVTRTFRVAFGGRLRRDDPMEIHIGGFNDASIHNLYEPYDRPNAYPTYASIPVIETLSDDLLLFPDEMERRLTAAIGIVENIRAHLNLKRPPPPPSPAPEEKLLEPVTAHIQPLDTKEQLFEHTCREGFRPVELLLHQWEVVKDCRQSLTRGNTDIRFAGTTVEERKKNIDAWIDNVMQKVLKLAQILQPAREGEPISLQLRQSTELGHRTVADERPSHWGIDDHGALVDRDLLQILVNPEREWDAKYLKFVTPQEKFLRDARKMVESSMRAKAKEVAKKAAEVKAAASASKKGSTDPKAAQSKSPPPKAAGDGAKGAAGGAKGPPPKPAAGGAKGPPPKPAAGGAKGPPPKPPAGGAKGPPPKPPAGGAKGPPPKPPAGGTKGPPPKISKK